MTWSRRNPAPHYLWTLVYGVKPDPSPDEKDLAIYRLVFERRAPVWPRKRPRDRVDPFSGSQVFVSKALGPGIPLWALLELF